MDNVEKIKDLLERTPNLFVLRGEYEEAAEFLDKNGATIVVKCGECAFCDAEGRCEAPENGLIREYVKPEDYCSYGKREK